MSNAGEEPNEEAVSLRIIQHLILIQADIIHVRHDMARMRRLIVYSGLLSGFVIVGSYLYTQGNLVSAFETVVRLPPVHQQQVKPWLIQEHRNKSMMNIKL